METAGRVAVAASEWICLISQIHRFLVASRKRVAQCNRLSLVAVGIGIWLIGGLLKSSGHQYLPLPPIPPEERRARKPEIDLVLASQLK